MLRSSVITCLAFFLFACMPQQYVSEENQNLSVRDQLEIGRGYFKNEKIKEAIEQYKYILENYKESKRECAWASYELAYCYYTQNKLNIALPAFENVVKEYPDQQGPVTLSNKMINQIKIKLKKR